MHELMKLKKSELITKLLESKVNLDDTKSRIYKAENDAKETRRALLEEHNSLKSAQEKILYIQHAIKAVAAVKYPDLQIEQQYGMSIELKIQPESEEFLLLRHIFQAAN